MLRINSIWVQIGTKDGDDEFRQLCIQFRPSLIILIEPNKDHIADIQKNYANFENINIENIAITAEDQDSVTLVRPRLPINGIDYDTGKYSIIPMDNWGDDFITIQVRSMTFAALCQKYNISWINYLQIDTEGYDSEIIRSIDFDNIRIDVLKYEVWNYDASCFKRHGVKGTEYGASGIKIVESLLKKRGYKFQADKHDMIAYVEY